MGFQFDGSALDQSDERFHSIGPSERAELNWKMICKIYEGKSFILKMGQFGLEENADYLKTKLCPIEKIINRNFNVNITRIKSLIFQFSNCIM